MEYVIVCHNCIHMWQTINQVTACLEVNSELNFRYHMM